MAFIPAIGAAVGGALATAAPIITGIAGISSMIGGLFGAAKTKIAATQALPQAPKPEDAYAKAKDAAANKRRISLLSGGTTNKTGPLGASVDQGNVLKKTLGGA